MGIALKSIRATPASVARVLSKGLIRMRVKFAGADVSRNGSVELLRVESLEPRAKPLQLARVELFNGGYDIFDCGHVETIAFALPSLHASCAWRGGVGGGGVSANSLRAV
jgi:hypothetical protein